MIRNIIEEERPRERLIKYGSKALSNTELLAIILKSGTKNISVTDLAQELLIISGGIDKLNDLTLQKLLSVKGIGTVKALEVLASIELGKRINRKEVNNKLVLNNSKLIFEYFSFLFEGEKQENFYAVYLDTKSKLIKYKLLFKGTINTSCVHPREIFKYAVIESAYSIIVMHNHPSGDVTPSMQDIELTKSLFELGRIMAIPVVDHIIFGYDKYYSFYENMNKQ